ncbi:MAG: hypothetical protein ABI852_12760, partial [Gemmatimonadaceae bacterium]
MANESTNKSSALVTRVQSRLVMLSWIRAIAFGVIGAVMTWIVVSLLFQMIWPSHNHTFAPVFAVAAALASGALVIWLTRSRDGEITKSRAALWLEERFPALQFSLVTLAEFDAERSSTLSDSARQRLVLAVGQPNVNEPLNRSAVRQLRVPVLMAVLLLAVAAPLQARLSRSVSEDTANTSGKTVDAKKSAKSNAKALTNWHVRVIPPSYSALETRELDDASQVAALVGSRIEISGDDGETPTAIVRSTVDSVAPASLAITQSDKGWRTQFVMPTSPADARFTLGSTNRQLLLEPHADSIPVVHLQLPVRDSVVREAKGTVALDASAHDDLGLATVNFELIVTSGEGERFTAKTVVLGAQRLNGDHEHKWQSSLSLDTMKLLPGDIVHMRAVARDHHPDASHEMGASETRTFR